MSVSFSLDEMLGGLGRNGPMARMREGYGAWAAFSPFAMAQAWRDAPLAEMWKASAEMATRQVTWMESSRAMTAWPVTATLAFWQLMGVPLGAAGTAPEPAGTGHGGAEGPVVDSTAVRVVETAEVAEAVPALLVAPDAVEDSSVEVVDFGAEMETEAAVVVSTLAEGVVEEPEAAVPAVSNIASVVDPNPLPSTPSVPQRLSRDAEIALALEAGTRPAGLEAPRADGADDLTMIRGIGPKNRDILSALGIYHFDQIASWTPAEVDWVSAYLRFPGRVAREDWVNQAAALDQSIDTYRAVYGRDPG